MALKDNIKNRRNELDITLEDVAKIVGVTRATVQKYENGIISNIPSNKIELLAQALHTTPAYLMGWDNNDENTKPATVDSDGIDDARESLIYKIKTMDDADFNAVVSAVDALIARRGK